MFQAVFGVYTISKVLMSKINCYQYHTYLKNVKQGKVGKTESEINLRGSCLKKVSVVYLNLLTLFG